MFDKGGEVIRVVIPVRGAVADPLTLA